MINPLQTVGRIKLAVSGEARVLFRDSGRAACLYGDEIELGPEQMAMVGFGSFSQHRPNGCTLRSTGGAPPNGTKPGQILCIQVYQAQQPLDVRIQYDKAIWSGLSWAAAEVDVQEGGADLEFLCTTTENEAVVLKADLYHLIRKGMVVKRHNVSLQAYPARSSVTTSCRLIAG